MMKKTIVVVLMIVGFATPCFAQEVEADGIFSIDGTLWNVFKIKIEIGILNGKPYLPPPEYYSDSMGFYQGTVHSCNEIECQLRNDMSYIDTLVVSIAYNNRDDDSLYVMQPSGIGIGVRTSWIFRERFMDSLSNPVSYQAVVYSIGIMFKADDNWTPPEVE
jgi:hypothetical protein